MIQLVLAALFLPASHFLVSSTSLRPVLVRSLGLKAYQAAYSVLAAAAFAWLVFAAISAPTVRFWSPPAAIIALAVGLDLLGVALMVLGLTTANPVIVRSDQLFDRADIVRGALRISRNNFFWGAGLVSLAHALNAGRVVPTLAFASAAFLGLAGGAIMDARKARSGDRRWPAFADATSNLPFLAILQGRQRLELREIGLWRIALILAVAVAVMVLHPALRAWRP